MIIPAGHEGSDHCRKQITYHANAGYVFFLQYRYFYILHESPNENYYGTIHFVSLPDGKIRGKKESVIVRY